MKLVLVRNSFVIILFCGSLITNVHAQLKNDRLYWLQQMDRIARPVIENLANDQLKANMPVEMSSSIDNQAVRKQVAYLEAFGRTLSGIGPWINGEGGTAEEQALRKKYREWSLAALKNAVNPKAKDYLRWDGGQPLVDAAFLALGLIRTPWLWEQLDTVSRQQLVDAFLITRKFVPYYSNWILFSGMIEAFFCEYGLDYDAVRLEFAIREFANHWYVGDGMFSDGMQFHLDYYNSIVIQPFLHTIVQVVNTKRNTFAWYLPTLKKIEARYAEIQERTINTDGTYPVIGRSIAYRGGAFHHLAAVSLRGELPETLKPGQVRAALAAVLSKTLESKSSFDSKGWLKIGLYGSQPDIADSYITTGSLYLCCDIFLPLGLSATDPFWADPAEPWSAVKAWSGGDLKADHAMDLESH